LFRGRYKANLVDTDSYLTALVRYIHLNPVVAKICQNPKDHKWTSHRYYLKEVKSFEWLYTREVLREYGQNLKEARHRFDMILRSKINEEVIREIECPKNGILGGQNFKEWVNTNFIEDAIKKDKEVAQRDKFLRPQIKAKQLLDNIGFCYDINLSQLRSTKTGEKNEARSLAIYLMRQRKGYSLKLIAKWLQASNEYAIAQSLKRFKKELKMDKKLLKRIRELERVCLEISWLVLC